MKTFTKYESIPGNAAYLGSEHPDGSMDEFISDALDNADYPICYRDPDGIRHYFDAFMP